MFCFKIYCYNGSGLLGTVSAHIDDSYVDTKDDCVYVVTGNEKLFWRQYGKLEERFGLTAVPIV